ncbi:MAG: hypothetical protein ACR2MN_06545 [Acidimicrobiales bacterium]
MDIDLITDAAIAVMAQHATGGPDLLCAAHGLSRDDLEEVLTYIASQFEGNARNNHLALLCMGFLMGLEAADLSKHEVR